jgi:hypothetical protein
MIARRLPRLFWALAGMLAVLAGAGQPVAATGPAAAASGAGTENSTDTTADTTTDATTDATLLDWRAQFEREVDRRLDLPPADQQRYLTLLAQTLVDAAPPGPLLPDPSPQAFVLVDRSPQVQAAFIVLRRPGGAWFWLGATAVSTGKVGSYEHFRTPLGVFAHTLENPDFRAEGTFNENHIRGYGLRGRRVFDFGWQLAERGWGAGGNSLMRFQMHATDPTRLEARLGGVASEGCIRIPATLNVFLDRHGLLDADYEQALAAGEPLWLIKPGRPLIPWPGRWLVIVDSLAAERPAWSPLPGAKLPAKP